ncbi:hypothetical protein EGH21_04590 [Halomicroarcula sp. F13]|uniref:Uncharacterized protein n=1 Tax=Haloarcula rubra TaxID=2487747 RepID=A0AAW4PP47_9EURY|nr:hypothetical protein [Halomicroarcula rubra]MBX0322310.1 hypothetical protein [Halomicroarcula rubra]
MVTPPAPGRWDAAAAGSVAALLVVAYVVVPDATVQYGAWLLVFCIWMAWFVAFGARWLYGE